MTGDRGRECQQYSQGLGGHTEAGIMAGFFVRGWNQRRDAVTVGALGQKQKERPILASLPPVSHQRLQTARPRQTSAWKAPWRGQLPCHTDLSPTWALSHKSYQNRHCKQIFNKTNNQWYTGKGLGFLGSSGDKESACNAGDPSSIPGIGGVPGEQNGCPLQYSCLENPKDRGATVHGVTKSRTWLKWLTLSLFTHW